MPSTVENLQQTYDNLVALRKRLSESPKPNITIDGEKYDWGDYMDTLTKNIAAAKLELEEAQGDDIIEETTQAYT